MRVPAALSASGRAPPRVLPPRGGPQNPFLPLWGLAGAEASMRSVFSSEGRVLHPKSLQAPTVGEVLFRAVFCLFFTSSRLTSSPSSRNALTEMELLPFLRQPGREGGWGEQPFRARLGVPQGAPLSHTPLLKVSCPETALERASRTLRTDQSLWAQLPPRGRKTGRRGQDQEQASVSAGTSRHKREQQVSVCSQGQALGLQSQDGVRVP